MQALRDPKSGIFQLRGEGWGVGVCICRIHVPADSVFVSRSVSVLLYSNLYLYLQNLPADSATRVEQERKQFISQVSIVCS